MLRMHRAVESGDVKKVRKLIRRGFDVNVKDEEELTALHLLVLRTPENALEIAELLISAGADVNSQDQEKTTPLGCLCFSIDDPNSYQNELELGKYLISKNADVNAKDFLWNSPLHMAVHQDHELEFLKHLLESGAIVDAQNRDLETPLFLAIKTRKFEAAQALIAHGAEVDKPDKKGRTPLHEACRGPRSAKKFIELLLHSGANPNAVSASSKTPLIYLLEKGHFLVEKIKLLLQHGADVNYATPSGVNVLSYEQSPKVWKSLLEHMAVLQALDRPFNQDIVENVPDPELREYFARCKEELTLAKKTELHESRFTFFHLIKFEEERFFELAGNKRLLQDYRKKKELFAIYGKVVQLKVNKATKKRRLWDKAVSVLSNCLSDYHLPVVIVEKILRYLDEDEVSKLCENPKQVVSKQQAKSPEKRNWISDTLSLIEL